MTRAWTVIADSILDNIDYLDAGSLPMEDPLVLEALTIADNVLDAYVCNLRLRSE